MWQTAPLEMFHRFPEGHPYPAQSAVLGPPLIPCWWSWGSGCAVTGTAPAPPSVASVKGPKLCWSESFLPTFQIDLEEEGETSSPGS